MSLAIESLALRAQAEQIAAQVLPNGGRAYTIADPDTVQTLLAALRDGNYRETACKVAGISKVTFYAALKRAETGDEAAQAFLNAVEKAEAEAENETVCNVRSASKLPQFWAAGMTYLERKHPDRWGRRQDDQSVPKVVVQIGARDSDVQVQINTTFASQDATVSTGFHSLTGDVVSDNQSYVTPSTSMPAVIDVPDQAATARDPAEGPSRGGPLLGVDGGVSGKGVSRKRAGGKKKGATNG